MFVSVLLLLPDWRQVPAQRSVTQQTTSSDGAPLFDSLFFF